MFSKFFSKTPTPAAYITTAETFVSTMVKGATVNPAYARALGEFFEAEGIASLERTRKFYKDSFPTQQRSGFASAADAMSRYIGEKDQTMDASDPVLHALVLCYHITRMNALIFDDNINNARAARAIMETGENLMRACATVSERERNSRYTDG